MKKKPSFLVKLLQYVVAILVVGGALYCGSTHRELTSNVSGNSNSAKKTTSILAVGSTALQPLAEQAATMYEQSRSLNGMISVQGGGSGAGLTQVQAGSVQIGNSDVFAEQKKGIDASKLVDHKVAVLGIAPVVNKDVTVSNLSMQQLQDIFTGKITNWQAVGGKNEPIVVINRASGSGTRTVFESVVLNGQTAVKAQEQDSNGTVQKIVGSTPGAISYLGFGYITGSSLKSLSVDNVKPTASNVGTNSWKIWGYEHMYTNGQPSGDVASYIGFFLSQNVQHGVVSQLGYIPLDQMKVDKNAQGVVSPK